jgi:hypothetical protein
MVLVLERTTNTQCVPKGPFMAAMKIMRIVLIGSVLTMLVQATFAGKMLGGDDQAANLHEMTAKVLVLLGCAQLGMAILLRSMNLCPRWLVAASALLLIAEVAEFALGHLHYVMVHVPLGVGIFGGAVRQLVWSVMQRDEGRESRA